MQPGEYQDTAHGLLQYNQRGMLLQGFHTVCCTQEGHLEHIVKLPLVNTKISKIITSLSKAIILWRSGHSRISYYICIKATEF